MPSSLASKYLEFFRRVEKHTDNKGSGGGRDDIFMLLHTHNSTGILIELVEQADRLYTHVSC